MGQQLVAERRVLAITKVLKWVCCYHSLCARNCPLDIHSRPAAAAAATSLQQFLLQQQPSRFRGPFEVLVAWPHCFDCCVHLRRKRCCRPYTPFRVVHGVPRVPHAARGRGAPVQRGPASSPRTLCSPQPSIKAQTPTPNPNPITLTLTPTSPCRPHRGTAIVSTAGFALPLAAAPSAACRYPDATETGQPSARSPP